MSRVRHVRCPRNPPVGRRLSIQRGTGTWAGCRGRPGEGLGRQDVSLRSTPGACGGARSVLVLAPHDGSGSLATNALVVLSPLLEWGAAAGGASGWGAGAPQAGPPGEERAQGMPPRDEATLMGGVPGRAERGAAARRARKSLNGGYGRRPATVRACYRLGLAWASPSRVRRRLRRLGDPTGLAGGQGGWPGRKREKPPTCAGGSSVLAVGQTVRTSVGSLTSAR